MRRALVYVLVACLAFATTAYAQQWVLVNGIARIAGGFVMIPGAQPGSTTTGHVYFDSSSNVLKFYNGTTWGNVGSGVAGSDTQVQFNDGGTQNGDAGLVFAKTTDILTVSATGVTHTGNNIRLLGTNAPGIEFAHDSADAYYLASNHDTANDFLLRNSTRAATLLQFTGGASGRTAIFSVPVALGGSLTASAGSLALPKITASGVAPGAAGLKLEVVCGTNAGTAKITALAGTSTTAVTVVDNVGTGVTGC